MGVKETLKNLRNTRDFYVRSRIRIGREVKEISAEEIQFQAELYEFLNLFSPEIPKRTKVLDIGTKNFSSAPVIENWIKSLGGIPEIVGIELDAYRRLSNFHTRADYGRFFESKVSNSRFIAGDFLEFNEPLDLALLLNPFVSLEPLLKWGLPKSQLKPKAIFSHAKELLPSGFLLVCSPTQEEFEISCRLAKRSGFTLCHQARWSPKSNTVQRRPRIGALFR